MQEDTINKYKNYIDYLKKEGDIDKFNFLLNEQYKHLKANNLNIKKNENGNLSKLFSDFQNNYLDMNLANYIESMINYEYNNNNKYPIKDDKLKNYELFTTLLDIIKSQEKRIKKLERKIFTDEYDIEELNDYDNKIDKLLNYILNISKQNEINAYLLDKKNNVYFMMKKDNYNKNPNKLNKKLNFFSFKSKLDKLIKNKLIYKDDNIKILISTSNINEEKINYFKNKINDIISDNSFLNII